MGVSSWIMVMKRLVERLAKRYEHSIRHRHQGPETGELTLAIRSRSSGVISS
jgi:hypothetical protein